MSWKVREGEWKEEEEEEEEGDPEGGWKVEKDEWKDGRKKERKRRAQRIVTTPCRSPPLLPSLPLTPPRLPQPAAGTATLALCVLYIFACIGFWGFAKDFRVNPSDAASGRATGCDTLLGEKGRGDMYTHCTVCCIVLYGVCTSGCTWHSNTHSPSHTHTFSISSTPCTPCTLC